MYVFKAKQEVRFKAAIKKKDWAAILIPGTSCSDRRTSRLARVL